MSAPAVSVRATETGDSPFSVRIAIRAHAIIGDEPIDVGGRDLGPAPFELLSASLAECTAMTVRWFARQRNWPLDHVEVSVAYRKSPVVGAHTVDSFEKTVSLRGPRLTLEQRARLLDVAGKCPVQRVLEGSPIFSLKPDPAFDETTS